MKIHPSALVELLKRRGITSFAGVPDSLLKELTSYISDTVPKNVHLITSNEGNAIAWAAGRFLGNGDRSVIYMQNSGIGNAINPLLSLADKEVYSIPMLLVIGWRGEPRTKDEPQHIKQGRIMEELLKSLEIPYYIVDPEEDDPLGRVEEAISHMNHVNGPVACLVKKGLFSRYLPDNSSESNYTLTREKAIGIIMDSFTGNELFVTTTGMTSREVYEHVNINKRRKTREFLTVGSMGHASSIGLGLSQVQRDCSVIVLDGDGSLLMHMGSMAINGSSNAQNLVHVVLNNGAHDSVGGQPTVGLRVDFVGIAKACGYTYSKRVNTEEALAQELSTIRTCSKGPKFLEVRVRKGFRKNLGRPDKDPITNRDEFIAACMDR